jgi:uroporphyrin-3 C-methyltransferase
LSVRLESLINLTSRAPLLVPDGAVPIGKQAQGVQAKSVTQNTQSATSSSDNVVNTDTNIDSAVINPSNPKQSVTIDDSASWWVHLDRRLSIWGQRILEIVAKDLADVVSIKRVNDPNALLLSPEQGAQLRENLRARLLTAQLSLLMRQPNVWRDELAMVESILQSRFDTNSFDTLAAINLVHELQAIPVSAVLPDIAGSFSALEAVRTSVSRATKGAE